MRFESGIHLADHWQINAAKARGIEAEKAPKLIMSAVSLSAIESLPSSSFCNCHQISFPLREGHTDNLNKTG
jgi:hypothetical protein